MDSLNFSRSLLMRAFYTLFLLGINAAIIWPLFSVEFLPQWHSIEGTFIALAKEMYARPFDFGWFWQWNHGMPFQHTYVPGLPAIAAVTTHATGFSTPHSYHVVSALLYALGPVTLFWLALYLTGRIHVSFTAAALYSLFAPSALLIPGVAGDLGGWRNGRRLHTMIQYGESTHTASLTFLPLALLFFHLYFERRKPTHALLAGVFSIATVLTNAFGAASLGFALICLLAARRGDVVPSALRAGAIGIAAYFIASPLLPPSVLTTISRNNALPPEERLGQLAAIGILAVLFPVSLWLLRQDTKVDQRFAILFSMLLTAVCVLGTWFGLQALPQAHRYHIEMEMALCLLAALGIGWAARRWHKTAPILVVLLLVAGLVQFRHYRRFSRSIISSVNPAQSAEFHTAQLLAAAPPGEIVMPDGSNAFWFNVFSDAPQMFGGHYPFRINPVDFIAEYIISYGFPDSRDASVRVSWLKAFGVHAVAVSGPTSSEAYKPYKRNYEVFDGVFPVISKTATETIYRVPQRTLGIAHVVAEAALVTQPPINGIDTALIDRYVQSLDDASMPVATVTRKDSRRISIRTTIAPGQVLSLQTNYHPGWHASADGKPAEVASDGLGLMVVRAACDATCQIEMVFDGGLEWKITLWLSAGTLFFAILWWRREARRPLSNARALGSRQT